MVHGVQTHVREYTDGGLMWPRRSYVWPITKHHSFVETALRLRNGFSGTLGAESSRDLGANRSVLRSKTCPKGRSFVQQHE